MIPRAPLTAGEKDYIHRKKEQGVHLGQIGQELACSYPTVRKWWRYQRDGYQPRLRGRPVRGAVSTFPQFIREKAIELKKAHPHWGPASVKLELKRCFPFAREALPSDARLFVLFHQCCPEAVQPRHRRETRPQTCQVSTPHQRWQMDSKEGVRVAADFVTILEVRDLFSGLMIEAHPFVTTTPKRWRRLSLAEYQQRLRWAFQTWGLPLEIQTDHDGIFILPEDSHFPSLFTLWLVGLGVAHVTSRPYRPTDQGSIERNHRTLGDFAWKDRTFAQVTDLQEALNEHRQRYNEDFPCHAAHCDGRPPLVAFPQAHSTGRPYHPAYEWQAFSLERTDAYLAQFVWSRPVMANGVVNLGKQHYYVGRRFHGQRVSAQFIPTTRSFRFQSADGLFTKDIPVLGLAKEDILGFIPAELALPLGFQFPLPLVGV
jgi:transposase InsO family protein